MVSSNTVLFIDLLVKANYTKRHGMSDAEYRKLWQDYKSNGYSPKVLTGTRTNNGDQYAAIWQKAPVCWTSFHGMNEESFLRMLQKDFNEGYVVTSATAFESEEFLKFNLAMEKPNPPCAVD